MYVKKLLSLVSAILALGFLHAQDIHFTQFNMSPMTLNPSLAGQFEGTVRIGGIYRSQWSSVIRNEFQTPSAFVDAPIIRGFRKRDWIGVGFMLFQDKAGTGGLVHGAAKLGASYHLALNKKGTTVLSLGAHYGGEQRRINYNELRFEKGWTESPSAGNYSEPNSGESGTVRTDNAQYNDIDAGINLTSKLNKRMDFTIGFGMYHLTEPNYSLLSGGGGNPDIPRRSVLHGVFNIGMNDRWTISPSFLYQTMSGADEINLQGLAGYLFNEEKEITLNVGLGYRFRDAIPLLVGMKYKSLTVGAAYDINTSDLTTVSNYRGGFEIAANYIVKIYKPSVIKPKVLCPRF